MVKGAEPGGIVECIGAAVAAESNVVQLDAGVAALGKRTASGIALVGGAADARGELVAGLADVKNLALATEHDRDDRGVAGQSARGVGRNLPERCDEPLLTESI